MQVYDPYRYIAQTSSYISDYKGLQSTEEKKDPNPVFAPILAKNFFVQAVQIALPSQEYVLIKEWMVWISVPENCDKGYKFLVCFRETTAEQES
ncbi:hypothetical protein F5890DRAFT_1560666 [Lentinula detonsa]|uniref:Uncharacterized protein n=1 Tax=Lentinula detonsa TaxID=2804962 RepID=A0AA38PME0_9AGAR|nr:hypothetical protein F5890DRAFT_1560666 [Lentinula detonsa]